MLVPAGTLELPGPFAKELGVTVPQPETRTIPRDINPAIWAKRSPGGRDNKVATLEFRSRNGDQKSEREYEEIAGRVTRPLDRSQSLSGNSPENFGHQFMQLKRSSDELGMCSALVHAGKVRVRKRFSFR